ncbi:MAG TPA: DUF599 domain-containing protein [Burkholderiaceae bacterium]
MVVSTLAILGCYEVLLALVQLRHPERLARSAHASLRADWFAAVSAQAGSEILAVQTLRNSLMSATMTASTAALGLMGAVTLAAPSLRAAGSAGAPELLQALSPRLVLELVLMALLLASLVSSAMAIRYYNHAGFICAMPVGSPARQHWARSGAVYVRRAGLLYSWGLRQLIMVAPVLASMLLPAAGPVAAGLVLIVMFAFDRLGVHSSAQRPA